MDFISSVIAGDTALTEYKRACGLYTRAVCDNLRAERDKLTATLDMLTFAQVATRPLADGVTRAQLLESCESVVTKSTLPKPSQRL